MLINKSDTTALSNLSTNDSLARSFDTALTGCTVTFSVIDNGLQDILKNEAQEGALGLRQKTRYAWKEDTLAKAMDELRGQQDALSLLVTVVQSHSLVEILGLLREKDAIFKNIRHNMNNIHRTTEGSEPVSDDELDTLDTYSIFSECTEQGPDFESEILRSRAYRKVYYSVQNAQRSHHRRRTPVEPVANLLDEDLIDLHDYPVINATYSKELQREMLDSSKDVPKLEVSATLQSFHFCNNSESKNAEQSAEPSNALQDTSEGLNILVVSREEHVPVDEEYRGNDGPATGSGPNSTEKPLLVTIEPGDTEESEKGRASGNVNRSDGLNELSKSASTPLSTSPTPHEDAGEDALAQNIPIDEIPPSPEMEGSNQKSEQKSKDYQKQIKIALVRDCLTGISCLCNVFTGEAFTDYSGVRTFQTWVKDLRLNGEEYQLDLLGTAGVEGYERHRPVFYPGTHVSLICFSIDNPYSLESILDRWIPEVSQFLPNVPIILVGCKCDLRYDPKTIAGLHKTRLKPVTVAQGEKLRKKIGAVEYLECSAKTGEGVCKVCETAVRTATIYKQTLYKEQRFKKKSGLFHMFG